MADEHNDAYPNAIDVDVDDRGVALVVIGQLGALVAPPAESAVSTRPLRMHYIYINERLIIRKNLRVQAILRLAPGHIFD